MSLGEFSVFQYEEQIFNAWEKDKSENQGKDNIIKFISENPHYVRKLECVKTETDNNPMHLKFCPCMEDKFLVAFKPGKDILNKEFKINCQWKDAAGSVDNDPEISHEFLDRDYYNICPYPLEFTETESDFENQWVITLTTQEETQVITIHFYSPYSSYAQDNDPDLKVEEKMNAPDYTTQHYTTQLVPELVERLPLNISEKDRGIPVTFTRAEGDLFCRVHNPTQISPNMVVYKRHREKNPRQGDIYVELLMGTKKEGMRIYKMKFPLDSPPEVLTLFSTNKFLLFL